MRDFAKYYLRLSLHRALCPMASDPQPNISQQTSVLRSHPKLTHQGKMLTWLILLPNLDFNQINWFSSVFNDFICYGLHEHQSLWKKINLKFINTSVMQIVISFNNIFLNEFYLKKCADCYSWKLWCAEGLLWLNKNHIIQHSVLMYFLGRLWKQFKRCLNSCSKICRGEFFGKNW